MPTETEGVLRGIGGIAIRVKVREHHNISSKATQYAIENGDSVSDHVVRTPNTVDVTFEMTNTTDSDGDGPSRAITAFMSFVERQDRRTPFILDTEHARYKNMVIVSFTPDHSAPNRWAFRATVRMQQVGIIGEVEVVGAQGGREAQVLAAGTNWRTRETSTQGRTVRTVSDAKQTIASIPLSERYTTGALRLYDTTRWTGSSLVRSGVVSVVNSGPLFERVIDTLSSEL